MINQTRGPLAEYGIILGQGEAVFRRYWKPEKCVRAFGFEGHYSASTTGWRVWIKNWPGTAGN